jgi:hypothetical protein
MMIAPLIKPIQKSTVAKNHEITLSMELPPSDCGHCLMAGTEVNSYLEAALIPDNRGAIGAVCEKLSLIGVSVKPNFYFPSGLHDKSIYLAFKNFVAHTGETSSVDKPHTSAALQRFQFPRRGRLCDREPSRQIGRLYRFSRTAI